MRRYAGVGLICVGLGIMAWMALPSLRASTSPRDAAVKGVDSKRAVIEPPPKVVVDRPNHDFGVLDVGEHDSHVFIVRNEGAGPLRLKGGGTSCQCTRVSVDKWVVPAGDEARVTLEWETREPTEKFAHGVIFSTNDPDNHELMLRAMGKVRQFVSLSCESLSFGEVPRGESREESFFVHSQAAGDLRIVEATATTDAFAVRFEPADVEALVDFESARSCQRVVVTLRPRTEVGAFRDEIILRLASDELPAEKLAEPLRMPVVGQTVGDVSFYGAKTDRDGTTRLGSLPLGAGAMASLYVVIRGDHANPLVEVLETSHPWLSATIERDDEPSARRARFRVDLRVAEDAPEVSASGGQAAAVRLKTSLPDHPVLELPVHLTIYP